MRRLALVLIAICFSAAAHAGFLAGMVVGSALSSPHRGSKSEPPGLFLTADHDVVVCPQGPPGKCAYSAPVRGADSSGRGGVFDNPGGCPYKIAYDGSNISASLVCTPAQYAINAGYKKLYKVGTLVLGTGVPVLALEVGR